MFTIVDHSAVTLGHYVYPDWADALGWLMFAVVVTMIPLIAIIELVRARRAHPFLAISVRPVSLSVTASIHAAAC